MNKETVLLKLKEIFNTLNPDVKSETITLESKLKEDLSMTSLSMVYIVVAIENEFDIDMSDVSFNTFNCVNDVVEYILNNLTQ